MNDAQQTLSRILAAHQTAVDRFGEKPHAAAIDALAADVLAAWDTDGKLLICGNGGSAADSQHLAAELAGRYRHDRPGWPALALTTDTSALTAISNDFGFERVFARQVEALGNPTDVLLVISTSGNSANCVAAVAAAREKRMRCHGFLGGTGGALRPIVDSALVVPADDTPRIQELHLIAIHALCELLESRRLGTGEGDG